MAEILARVRYLAGALLLLIALAVAAPASAQQPSPTNPSGHAVKEEQLMQQLQRLDGQGDQEQQGSG